MAKRIYYETHTVETKANETVLDAFIRSGIAIPFSCRGGSCQTCAVRCLEGDIPVQAQLGLSDFQKGKKYLLTCKCIPTTDMTIAPLSPDDVITDAYLVSKDTNQLTIELGRSRSILVGDSFKLLVESQIEPEAKVLEKEGDWILTLVLPSLETTPSWLEALNTGELIKLRGPYSQQTPIWMTEEKKDPSPHLAIWQQLGEGKKVREVLIDFYDRVYADDKLAPFFASVTKTRLIEKQFSFMMYLFTRQHVHFGQRPKNLHHWMVISDDLMDHRRQILDDTFREHGLTDKQRHVWHQYEEHFRTDIVKDKPWPIKIGNEYVDLESFDKEVLDCATICDHCGEPVDAGVEVVYHRRTGKISCPNCSK